MVRRLFAVLVVTASAAVGQEPRPLTVDDVIALQQIRRVAISPDGEWTAVVIKRPGGPVTEGDDAYTDVWLLSRHGGAARNLTGSLETRISWWNPVWSPDGSRLALLSSTHEHDVKVYIWTMQSGTLHQLTDRDADLHATTEEEQDRPIVWIDSSTLLYAAWPVGIRPSSVRGSNKTSQQLAPMDWAKTEAGIEPAVSVLESGRTMPPEPQGQLLLVNVNSGQYRVVADGNFWQIIVSPTKRYAALVADAGRVWPSPTRRLLYDAQFLSSIRHSRLGIVRLDSVVPAHWVPDIIDPAIRNGSAVPHAWSSDGSMIAVVGKGEADAWFATTGFVVSATGAVRRISDRTLDITATAWAGNRFVMLMGRKTPFATAPTDTNRRDWWVVDAKSEATANANSPITEALTDVPPEWSPTVDTTELLGVAEGRLLSLRVQGGTLSKPIAIDCPSVEQMIWPNGGGASNRSLTDFVVLAANGEVYRVAIDHPGATPIIRRIPRPSSDASLAAVDPTHHLAIFTASARTGTYLWTGDGASADFDRRLALNQHLRAIAVPKHMLITYTGDDGDTLKGMLVLPPNYVAGKRYPMITFVTPGVIVTDTLEAEVENQQLSFLNPALLPAHGYVLLVPSMPIAQGTTDPMLEVPKGVLPAVDEAIRIGVADPTRLGVLGTSMGGYATYDLTVYTHRFRAAVALAAPADLASFYGTINPESRYTDFGYQALNMPGMLESGMGHMGDSPWGNLWRYARNSPYYYAERVDTPIMIIQGDVDYIPIQQSEEFFTALFRLGKRAKFVRYWGESHAIYRSPANVRDLWSRIYGWFDEELDIKGHSPLLLAR